MPRLVIRVNDAKPLDPDQIQPRREIVEYRWDRIIPALLVLLLLVGGVAWIAWNWSQAPDMAEPPVADSTPVFKDEVASAPAQIQLPKVADPASEIDADQPPAESSFASASAPSQSTPSQPAPVKSQPAPSEPTKPLASIPQPESSAATPAPVETKPSAAQTGEKSKVSSSKPAKVVIHSNKVKRAQLTTNVIDKAPVDQLNSIVPMNEQGLLRIYLFTETAGMSGRKIYHHWYRNGNQSARVRVPTGQKPVIASSSKFIDRNMTGSWQVKILDDRDNLLATAKFEVTP